MQDPNPMPWGAQDRYQAHFIVKKDAGKAQGNYLAKTKLATRGHFAAKSITGVQWDGPGALASRLNQDAELNSLISKLDYRDGTIYVEPTEGAVRIRGRWKNHLEFGITDMMFNIYDRIAFHIKQV